MYLLLNFCSPFERTANENDQIFNAIKKFEVMSNQFPSNVLKELCVVAQLDSWKEAELTGSHIFTHSASVDRVKFQGLKF